MFLEEQRIRLFVLVLFLLSGPIAYSDPGLKFIQNKNQWPAGVDFVARANGGFIIVQPGQLGYYLVDQERLDLLHEQSHKQRNESDLSHSSECIRTQFVQAQFVGANRESIAQPFGKSSEYYNYFLGSDSSHWSSDVYSYNGMVYSGIYSGIDMKITSMDRFLKYDFIISPGADPSQISFEYKGAESFAVVNGDLIIHTVLGNLIEKKPVSYQIENGNKVYIPTQYQVDGDRISFCFDSAYDACKELVIDPLLIFSTYSGSTADNWGSTATPGEHGSLYSSGVVTHINAGGTFPATPGAFQTSYGGLYDVALLKYDSSGQKLLYASYLGGSQSESPHSLVMNKSEELLVLGTTSSNNFPTTGGVIDRSFNGGTPEANVVEYNNGSDIFIAKISADGRTLLASTYIGGSANDGLNNSGSPLVKNYGDQLRGDIITDDLGNIYVSSVTSSPDFPATNSFNIHYQGGFSDALVMNISGDLTEIIWAALVGGSQADASHTIQIDRDGNLFVAGGTASNDFVVASNAYQPALAGGVDGWIAKIKGDGSSIMQSTLTGNPSFNQIYFIDLDKNEDVFVYGQTVNGFPVTPGVYSNANSGQFLQKFDNSLTTLKFSTTFGSGRGIPDISPTAFLVNDCNNIYMSGWGGDVNRLEGFWNSNTVGLPITPDAFQKTTSGSDFYFIVLSADGSQLLYSTFLGGTQSKTHVDGGTSRFDKSGIVYHAVCSGCRAFNSSGQPTSDFPTTAGAWSQKNLSGNCNNAAFKFDLSLLKARIQTNSLQLNHPGLTLICMPDKIVFQNRSTGGQFFEWWFDNADKQTKADTLAIQYQFLQEGRHIVKLKVTDQGTCQGKDSTTVAIDVYKPAGIAGADQTICFNESTRLLASGGAVYDWKTADNSFHSTEATPQVNPKEDTRYFVTIIDPHTCVTKDTLNLKVVPGIDLKFEAHKEQDCDSRPVVYVKNLTNADEVVYFDFGDGSTSDLNEAIHSYQKDGDYAVRLVGKKESCTYFESITLPFYYLRVPNVLTPALPGDNDTFKIHYGGEPISSTSLKVSLKIYNRWGNLIYQNADYKDNWGGEGVAAGTYYYEVEIEGETTCKGWVQLIK